MLEIIAIKGIVLAFSDSGNQHHPINSWLSIALTLTIAWMLAWSYLQIGWSLLIMTGIFISLFISTIKKERRPIITNITLALYLGWISTALVANESA